jgi:hypothetical protein
MDEKLSARNRCGAQKVRAKNPTGDGEYVIKRVR